MTCVRVCVCVCAVRIVRRTVAGKDLGHGAGRLAHHDGDVGVVLLHRGVRADEEVAVVRISHRTLVSCKAWESQW